MQYNMITRAQIRRQLRKEGGIMNVTPRQAYGLGSLVKSITKPFKKVLDVGKQVIKSPIGKAALLGLGGAGLMGYGPMSSGLSGIGARIGGSGIGQFFKGMGPKLFGATTSLGRAAGMPANLGLTGFTKTPGILGKLGLTKGGGSMMPTILGGVTAAGLMTYFMGKGKTEEEATQLAQDVKRGKGLGLDLIKADIKKYRTGDLSSSQMFDKGYHFLTPRNYIGAKGGRVNFQAGGVPTPYDVSEYEAKGYGGGDLEFLRWNQVPTSAPSWFLKELEQQKQHWDPSWGPFEHESWGDMEEGAKIHMMRELGPYQHTGIPANPNAPTTPPFGLPYVAPGSSAPTTTTSGTPTTTRSGGLGLGSIIKKVTPTATATAPTGRVSMGNTLAQNIAANKAQAAANQAVLQTGRARIKPAKGGRVKYADGPKKMNQDGLEFIVPVGQSQEKAFYDAIINDVDGIMSDKRKDEWLKLLVPQLIESGEMSREEKKELGFAKGGRIGKYGGGIGAGMPRIPTGMPRVNAGGITELDYRSTGGFVPMGVKEKADDVPAMLSKNEFVMTADAVKAAGGGSVEKGAQRMYDTMKRLEGKVV